MSRFLGILVFCMISVFSLNMFGQNTARLQVIHNAADPAAATVDVYVNGSMFIDNFDFREAIPFQDVPAGVTLNIGIAPGNSGSANDTLVNIPVVLAANGRYVAIANGVLNPSNFADNPDGESTGFALFIKDNARESSSTPGNFEFAVVHGASDAPTVDVRARNVVQLVDNVKYGDVTSNYISVQPISYTIDVAGANGSPIYAAFEAPLFGLADSAAIVFASGFVQPVKNQIGPLFGLFAALPNGSVVELPLIPARLQVIHNAADPAAASVDIYLNGALAVDDFDFREATPFIDVPGRLPLNIGIAPGNSTSFADTITTFTTSFREYSTYVAFANGVLDPSQFANNPDGRDIGFTIIARDSVYETGGNPANVSFLVFHGSTDAPTVDVIARGVGPIVDDIAYGDFNSNYYINVPEGSYTLDITPGNDNNNTVASFTADLTGLGGSSAVVFASGFFNPAANQNGPEFGLYAALPDGQVAQFPKVQTARLQVIHNAADPAAATVDVYVNGSMFIDDFDFRTATAFQDVPAGVTLNIGIAPGNSGSANDTLVNIPVILAGGGTYAAIANGVLNSNSFAPNPDGIGTGFQLLVQPMARETGSAGNVEFYAVHGATDAPTVDINARGFGTIFDNVPYTAVSSYTAVPPFNYIIDIADSTSNTVVASFKADLSGLAGGAAAVIASGFLNPGANQNGPAFGLIAVLPDGTVLELPSAPTFPFARLQVIHNAADPAASTVDVYVNGSMFIDDFDFRTATPFQDVPAGVTLDVGIALGNSGSVNDTLVNIPVVLTEGGTYAAIANGVLNPNAFAPNPDGISTAFQLLVQPMAQESASGSDVEFYAVHGATDAPTVDVIARGVGTLLDNVPYTAVSGYQAVPPATYTIDIADSTGSTVVASFTLDVSGLGGGAAAIIASGFLSPGDNQNGSAFGLIAVLPDGSVILLPSAPTGIEEIGDNTITDFSLAQNYPNPFNPSTTIEFAIPAAELVKIRIFNLLGQEVGSLVNERLNAGSYKVDFDASDLVSGVYFYRIEAGEFRSTKRMTLLK